MDENEEIKDDRTPSEEEAVEDDGMSGEEAHRFEELEELRSMIETALDGIETALDGIRSIQTSIGNMVIGGAVVDEGNAVDVDGNGDEDFFIDEADFVSAFDDLDLSM